MTRALLTLVTLVATLQAPPPAAVDRGPRLPVGATGAGRIALIFTGHEFAEGGDAILDALKRHGVPAAFFLTGDFLRTPTHRPFVQRLVADGHYLGPHSDKHLLYAGWDASRPTLVTRAQFDRDLIDNLREVERYGVDRSTVRWWVPPYEWFNDDIVRWSAEAGLGVVTFTRGTRANADYTGEADQNFVSSAAIVRSILAKADEPRGLDGFLLLMHVGAGPGRRDKMHDHLDELLDALQRRGYALVRLDDLLSGRPRQRLPDFR